MPPFLLARCRRRRRRGLARGRPHIQSFLAQSVSVPRDNPARRVGCATPMRPPKNAVMAVSALLGLDLRLTAPFWPIHANRHISFHSWRLRLTAFLTEPPFSPQVSGVSSNSIGLAPLREGRGPASGQLKTSKSRSGDFPPRRLSEASPRQKAARVVRSRIPATLSSHRSWVFSCSNLHCNSKLRISSHLSRLEAMRGG
jgi:hypothetical protein